MQNTFLDRELSLCLISDLRKRVEILHTQDAYSTYGIWRRDEVPLAFTIQIPRLPSSLARESIKGDHTDYEFADWALQ